MQYAVCYARLPHLSPLSLSLSRAVDISVERKGAPLPQSMYVRTYVLTPQVAALKSFIKSLFF